MTSNAPGDPGAFVKVDNKSHSSDNGIARLDHYRKSYLNFVPHDNFDRELWKIVKIADVVMDAEGKTAKATFEFTFPQRYANYTGHVMGGAIATMLDGVSNCVVALVARKDYWDRSGVTRNLNISYIRPVKRGEALIVECEILRVSPLLVTIQGLLKRASDDKLLAMCTQEMVAIRAKL